MRLARRVVVKIGTARSPTPPAASTGPTSSRCAAELLEAAKTRELVVVSSGAIALGVERLGYSARPKDIPGKQACRRGRAEPAHAAPTRTPSAGVGMRVAQVLLTHDDVAGSPPLPQRPPRPRARCSRHGVVPIINENDTVVGGRDQVRRQRHPGRRWSRTLVEADLLVILSDVEGLYYGRSRARIPRRSCSRRCEEVTARADALAGGAVSSVGTGGMATKVRAAARVAELGIRCVITSGQLPGRLRQVLAGEPVGTLFEPRPAAAQRADRLDRPRAPKPQGHAGGRRGRPASAVLEQKKSLLPSGIARVEGNFAKGDPVDWSIDGGSVFARGLAAYGADELAADRRQGRARSRRSWATATWTRRCTGTIWRSSRPPTSVEDKIRGRRGTGCRGRPDAGRRSAAPGSPRAGGRSPAPAASFLRTGGSRRAPGRCGSRAECRPPRPGR